jgi:large exoprotein involved in heme utilization and adhesion
MEGGILTAPEGRIEIGSIFGNGQARLAEQNWALSYGGIENNAFGNINLLQNKNLQFSAIVSRGENGGEVYLQAKNVTIADGSTIFTTVGSGSKSSIIKITALDAFALTGNSSLVTSAFGEGRGGDVVINAKKVSLRDLASIQTASSFTETISGIITANGRAGDVSITTSQLDINRGASINASTGGSGRGGDILINASESVKVFGVSLEDERPSIILTLAEQNSSGSAGDIRIDTQYLQVSDGAQINVSSQGTGSAGNLGINAHSIRLENQGFLSAQTTGEFGNITLNANDIVLRDNSNISTNATGTASGGNIAINTGALVGFENSDIVANAVTGSGGRVEISAKGIFGLIPLTRVELEQFLGTTDPLQLDPSQLPSSDITAISQSDPSLNGQVVLNTPEVDPSKGLVELPTTVVDPNSLVAQSPCRRGSRSEFTRSGRGGLPPSIGQDFNSDATQVALVTPASTSLDKQQTKPLTRAVEGTTSALSLESPVVPAQGWVFNHKGEVVLVADNAVVVGPQRLKTNPAGCPIP